MKKIDWKKLLLLILIVVAVIVIVFVVTKTINKKNDNPTEDQISYAEKLTINNICNLTKGYGTRYGGIDVLFRHDKVTYEDLSTSNVLNAAVRFAEDNLNPEISPAIIYNVEKQTPYRTSQYKFYTGDIIRQAIKELFGIDYENKVSKTELNYGYNFVYLSEFDVYLMSQNEYFQEKEENYDMTYTIISTTKEKKENQLKTEIAVAYTIKNGDKLLYLKEADADNAVYETNLKDTEITSDKLDEFNHYIITLKQVDGKYIFDSITKK